MFPGDVPQDGVTLCDLDVAVDVVGKLEQIIITEIHFIHKGPCPLSRFIITEIHFIHKGPCPLSRFIITEIHFIHKGPCPLSRFIITEIHFIHKGPCPLSRFVPSVGREGFIITDLTMSAGRLAKSLCPLSQFFLHMSVSRLTYIKKNGLVDTGT